GRPCGGRAPHHPCHRRHGGGLVSERSDGAAGRVGDAAPGVPEGGTTTIDEETVATATASESAPDTAPPGSTWPSTLRDISQKGWLVTVLALVVALVAGSILIIVSSPRVQETSAYFFARPWDTIYASIDA